MFSRKKPSCLFQGNPAILLLEPQFSVPGSQQVWLFFEAKKHKSPRWNKTPVEALKKLFKMTPSHVGTPERGCT